MRHYEMMVILTDLLDEERVQELITRIESIVTESGGQVTNTDYWGKREFAYEIDHRNHGYYVVFDFDLESEPLTELERLLKISDDVVRFKTMRPDVRTRNPGSQKARRRPA